VAASSSSSIQGLRGDAVSWDFLMEHVLHHIGSTLNLEDEEKKILAMLARGIYGVVNSLRD
jgi:hypothetical protein